MPSPIVTPDMAKGPDAAKIVPIWFLTDGTTDPSVFTNLIESVDRLTDDATGTPFYRVRLNEYEDLDTESGASVSLHGFAGGVKTDDPTLQLAVRMVDGLDPTAGGTDPREAGIEIDLVVSLESEAALLARIATASALAITAAQGASADSGEAAFVAFAADIATYAATVGATTGATNSVAAGQYVYGLITLNIGTTP